MRELGLFKFILLINFLFSSVTLLADINMNKNIKNEYKEICGTNLKFIPTLDFKESNSYSGYESIKYKTSLLVFELPINKNENMLDFFDREFTVQKFKKKGLTLNLKRKDIDTKYKSILFECTKALNGTEYVKWIYSIENSKIGKYAQIQLTSPKIYFDKIRMDVENMLVSFEWNDSNKLPNLYYSIELPENWKLSYHVASMELYSETGSFPIPEKESCIGIMNLMKSVEKIYREEFISKMNLNRNHYKNLEILQSENLIIDGFDANISLVSAYDINKSEKVIKLYCYIFCDGTVILIEGDQSEKLTKNIFKDIVKTWALKHR